MYYRLLFLILLEITAPLGAFGDHNYIIRLIRNNKLFRCHLLLPILKLDICTYQSSSDELEDESGNLLESFNNSDQNSIRKTDNSVWGIVTCLVELICNLFHWNPILCQDFLSSLRHLIVRRNFDLLHLFNQSQIKIFNCQADWLKDE